MPRAFAGAEAGARGLSVDSDGTAQHPDGLGDPPGPGAVACGRSGYTEIPPWLLVDRAALVFAAQPGELVEPAQLTLSNLAGTPLDWLARPDEQWLRVAPTSGTTPSTVAIQVSPTGLLAGEHRASITFETTGETSGLGEDTQAQRLVVWVRLTLTTPGWTSGNGPWGGTVYSLASDGAADGRVLAGDWSGRIWISDDADDGGQSFRHGEQLGGEIREIVLDGPTGVASVFSTYRRGRRRWD